MSTSTPYITDIVFSIDLNCQLDLLKIAQRASNTTYDSKLGAVIMTIRNPAAKAVLFQSGKMICSGNRTVERSRRAGRRFARILQLLDFNARFTKFSVVNLVARYDAHFKIRLELLAVSHFAPRIVYEPEVDPNLLFKMESVKILIFDSGKMVFSGAQKEKQVYDAFVNILPIVEQFREVTSQKIADC